MIFAINNNTTKFAPQKTKWRMDGVTTGPALTIASAFRGLQKILLSSKATQSKTNNPVNYVKQKNSSKQKIWWLKQDKWRNFKKKTIEQRKLKQPTIKTPASHQPL